MTTVLRYTGKGQSIILWLVRQAERGLPDTGELAIVVLDTNDDWCQTFLGCTGVVQTAFGPIRFLPANRLTLAVHGITTPIDQIPTEYQPQEEVRQVGTVLSPMDALLLLDLDASQEDNV